MDVRITLVYIIQYFKVLFNVVEYVHLEFYSFTCWTHLVFMISF